MSLSDLDFDDHHDNDEWVAATQIAQPPQLAARRLAAAAAAAATDTQNALQTTSTVDDRVLCAICSRNLSRWTIEDRAVHMNACLDATTLQSSYACPTCSKNLTDYNEQRRTAHVNRCLDNLCDSADNVTSAAATISITTAATTDTNTPTASFAPADTATNTYNCMICGVSLTDKTIDARIRHVKACGQRFGVRPSDVATLQPRQQEQPPSSSTHANEDAALQQLLLQSHTDDGRLSASNAAAPPNAFAVMMHASSAASSTAFNTIGRVTHVVSNAFDVLMKSSKTQAVLQSTVSLSTAAAASAASNWGGSSTANNKKRRLTNGTAASSSSSNSSWGKSTRPCPAFKRIKGTSFIVDGFQFASKALSSIYFLTHFHSDHYTGLDASFDCGVIYCNAVTAALVIQNLRIDPKYVHALPMNTRITIQSTSVTLMDANHCPGAAILLFELANSQSFLHVGDFRFDPTMLSYAPLQRYIQSCSIGNSTGRTRLDGVYLDTTYADPKYVFPTQTSAIDHTIALIDKHGAANDKILYLFGSYLIGKERLFMDVARRFRRKVCVSHAKRKLIATFDWDASDFALLTTETSATNLHVVPMHELKLDHLTALLQKHRLRFRQIVAFRPTGWTFSRASASLSTCRTDASGAIRIYGVPYSEHSSFAELVAFVKAMDPHVIIPTVNCHTEKAVKKQVDALRQSAFGSVATMLQSAAATTATSTT